MNKFTQSLGRFLRRAVSDLPTAISSNYVGLFFPALPAALYYLWDSLHKGWYADVRDIETAMVIAALSYLILFLYVVLRRIYREHHALKDRIQQIEAVISQVQLGGLRLAAEIRTYAESFGPIPPLPPEAKARHQKALWEHYHELAHMYPPETDLQLRIRLLHGFESRGFAGQAEAFMHQAGEVGYPISDAAGIVGTIFDRRSMLRLAFDIEIVVAMMKNFRA